MNINDFTVSMVNPHAIETPTDAARAADAIVALSAAPLLVQGFIQAANRIERAWAGGDLAGAVRELMNVRDVAEDYRV